MIKIGIIGTGNIGNSHANRLIDGKVPGAELVAICDTRPAAMNKIKEKLPEVKTFATATEMMDSGAVDAIVIATPHYDHPIIATEAIQKKIHVMVEKPIGVYTKSVRELNELAAQNKDVVYAIMYNQRTDPRYRMMRDMVQKGEIGEIKRTSWLITDWYRTQAYYDNGGWRATWSGEGGGVLINQCPHNLDLWQWICGMPKRVHAFAHFGKWHNIEVEDDVTAYVEYENGATGIFVTSTGDMPGNNRFEVLGDLGKLVCERRSLVFSKLNMSERDYNKNSTESVAAVGTGPAENEKIKADRIEIECPGENTQWAGVLAAFVEKINGTGELIAKGEEGINGLTISNAMHLSAWLGKTIELPLDEELFLSELNKRRK